LVSDKDRTQRLAAALAERYEFVAALGAGGFASVHKVKNLRLRRSEALKVLAQELSEESDFGERFEQEAHVSASLDHPNIVKIYDYGVTDGIAWFTMQLIEGTSLARQLRDSTEPLSEGEAAQIFIPLLEALEYSHARGVIHRDIKPDNIMLDAKRRPFLMDFGIAKAEDSAVKTRTGLLMGSPAYMAPEQIRGAAVDGRTDLYALGVTLYRALTRGYPFNAADAIAAAMKKLTELPEPILPKRPDVRPEFESIVMKALARHPNDRYRDAGEMREALEGYFDVFGFPQEKSSQASSSAWKRLSRARPASRTLSVSGSPSAPSAGARATPQEKTTPFPGTSGSAPGEDLPTLSPNALAPTVIREPTRKTMARGRASRRPLVLSLALLGLIGLAIILALTVGRNRHDRGESTAVQLTPSENRARVVPVAAAQVAPLPTAAPTTVQEPTPTTLAKMQLPLTPQKKPVIEAQLSPTRRERPGRPVGETSPEKQPAIPVTIVAASSVQPASAGFRYCAAAASTAYRQGAISEAPAGFSSELGQAMRGPRTDSARIVIEFDVRPKEPKEGETFEVSARLSNGGDSDLVVARVEESSPRESAGFLQVAGLALPATVSAGGVLPIYRGNSRLSGGGTYRKEVRVTDGFKDSWTASVVVKPCPE
jgi:serine/threonine protein kinase